ncbi:MAG: hypothetical protein RSA41_06150 [Christensenella sp.]
MKQKSVCLLTIIFVAAALAGCALNTAAPTAAAVQSAEPTASASAEVFAAPFVCDEVYEGDGYVFGYPQGTKALIDTKTAKSFLLPDKNCVLNVTRINLSGQDITLQKALPIYRATLEEQGNTVGEVQTLADFAYDNAMIEVELMDDGAATNSAQVFFIAEGYNYTFTVSCAELDMEVLKQMVSDVVHTFKTS